MARCWSLLVIPCVLAGYLGCNQGAHGGSSSAAAKAPEAETDEAAVLLLVAADAALALEAAAAAEALALEGQAGAEESGAEAREPDAEYVAAPEPVVEQMLELADVREGDVVFDLGCGDGRIVIMAAERYGVHAVGFDVDPEVVAEARANVEAAGVEDLVTIEQQDIFEVDLSLASVVTLDLSAELNDRLLPQLRTLKPGSRIVSHEFGLSNIEPVDERSLRVPGRGDLHQIYLWDAPLPLEQPAAEPAVEVAPTSDEARPGEPPVTGAGSEAIPPRDSE